MNNADLSKKISFVYYTNSLGNLVLNIHNMLVPLKIIIYDNAQEFGQYNTVNWFILHYNFNI